MGCDTFAPDVNGAASFAERLAAGLVQRGHDVHIVAPAASRKHGTWVEEHQGSKMTVHRLLSWRWYPHDWLRFALPWTSKANARRILDEVKPDVVHIQSHIVVGRGLAAEAEKRGIRIVATNHVMAENVVEFTLLPKFLQKIFVKLSWADARKSFDRAESVTTPTRKAAEFLEASTGLRGVHAISCGIDAHNYIPDFSKRAGNHILFVGRVTGEKQIDVLLNAIKLLPASLDARLQIVGGGDRLRSLQTMAEPLGIAGRVDSLGYVSDEELRQAYTHATVFAMPSIAELQSIATMEAMASALPVVAADAMALPHLVHEGENGYLFPPGDVQALADRIERVLRLPEEELLVMKNASLRLIEPHDIETTLQVFERLYRGEYVEDPVTEVPPLSAKLREQFRSLRRRARERAAID